MLFVLAGIFVSCNTLQINDPSKQMLRPGFPTGTTMISYSFSMTTSEEIKINSISLLRNGNQTSISNYTLFNLEDGKILKPEVAFSKGKYYISFKIEAGNLNIDEPDSIIVEYVISGKLKRKVIKPEVKSDLLMK